MRSKMIPRTLFGMMMLVIASVLLIFALVTGTLSLKETRRLQVAIMEAQIAEIFMNPEEHHVLDEQVPQNLRPALPHMRKMLKYANKKAYKNYALFFQPGVKNAYWLHHPAHGWFKVDMEVPAIFWAKHFIPQILLMLFLIGMSAFILSRSIKKPLEQLTKNLLLFKNNREIGTFSAKGPKEIQALLIEVKNMMTSINEFDAQRQLVLAGVAHDICTPLSRIRIALEMLPSLDPHSKQALIKDIEQIDYLQEQFLRYTSIKQEQTLQALDLCGLLESCVEQYPQNSIELILPSQSVLINADPNHLKRGFENVLTNAFQYGAPPVKIKMEITDHEVMISITDSGEGVPEELLPKITQPLYRANSARSNTEGTGLGLSIFVEVIQALKGRVELANARPQGLQVKVFLPKS